MSCTEEHPPVVGASSHWPHGRLIGCDEDDLVSKKTHRGRLPSLDIEVPKTSAVTTAAILQHSHLAKVRSVLAQHQLKQQQVHDRQSRSPVTWQVTCNTYSCYIETSCW